MAGKSVNRKKPDKAIGTALLIALLCCLLYGNTLRNGYALDDRAVITENSLTKQGIAGIGDLVTHDHFYGCNQAVTGLYRPIPMITHAVEYGIAGQNPTLGHLVNLLLYILACLGLWYGLREMLQGYNPLIPAIAVMLFAVHPVHTEIVANIKGRDELLNLVFLSLTMVFSFRFARHSSALALLLSMLFFLLALLSKESAMTFIAVIPLALWFFSKAKPVSILMVLGGLIGMAGIYLLVRSHYVDASAEYRILDAYHQHCDSRSLRMATSVGALVNYLKLFILPYPLVYDYSYNQVPLSGWGSLRTLASVVIHLFLLAYALVMLPRRRILSFCILVYFITLSVFANILTPTSAVFAERFLFIPSFACCLALSWAILRLFKIPVRDPVRLAEIAQTRRWLLLAVMGLFMVIPGILTIARNNAWKDDYTLFTTDLPYLQNNARAHYNLAAWYAARVLNNPAASDTSMAAPAIRGFEETVAIDPEFSEAWFILGALKHHQHEYRAAIRAFGYAERTATKESPPMYSAGMARLNAGKSWFRLGESAFNAADYDSALVFFSQSAAADPANINSWLNIAGCHYNLNRPDSASVYYLKVTRLDPREANGWNGLGLVAWAQRRYPEATGYFKKAVELNPGLADNYRRMGVDLR